MSALSLSTFLMLRLSTRASLLTPLLESAAMSLLLPVLAIGSRSMRSKAMKQFWHAPSTMLACTGSRTRLPGTMGTASPSCQTSWLTLANRRWSLQVLRGAVSWPSAPVAISLKPPGTAYRSETVFDLKRMQPYGLDILVRSFRMFTPDIALYLPRSADLRQLAATGSSRRKVGVVHYCMDGASKVSVTK